MTGLDILAQAAGPAAGPENTQAVYSLIADVWKFVGDLSWVEAVLAVSFGVVYMLYGWRIFRILVVICFGLIGMILGMLAGQELSGPGSTTSQVMGGLLGCAVLAFVAVPLMKWCVSLFNRH